QTSGARERKFPPPLKSPQDSSPFRCEAGEPAHRNNGGIPLCTVASRHCSVASFPRPLRGLSLFRRLLNLVVLGIEVWMLRQEQLSTFGNGVVFDGDKVRNPCCRQGKRLN